MNKSTKKILSNIIVYTILGLVSFIFLFPVIWMISNSFKTEVEVYNQLGSLTTFLPSSDPKNWFTAHINLFTTFDGFGKSVLNSIVYCSITIAGVLLINSFAGYAISRFVFPGHKFLISFIIILLIIPIETSITPTYIILKNLGLLETNLRVAGYLLPSFVFFFF